jgi:lipopolysaccharide transport system permease protein
MCAHLDSRLRRALQSVRVSATSLTLKNTRGTLNPLAGIWQFRELFRQLLLRNLKIRYQRSGLGFLWLLLNPALTIVLLVVVFGAIMRLPVASYWAFLVSGYFAWVFLFHTLGASAFVVPDHAEIARSVAVPADVFVLATVTARFLEFAVEMLLAIVLLAVFHHHGLPGSFALLPVLMLLLLSLTLGLAMPIAAVSVFFRDIEHGLPAMLMMLMWISPVFYPERFVPPRLATLYALNPVAMILTMFHRTLYEGEWPLPGQLAIATLAAGTVFFVGQTVFRRLRGMFAEVV